MRNFALYTFAMSKRAIYGIVALSMVLSMFAFLPGAQAETLKDLTVTLGHTKPATDVNLQIKFTTATAIEGDETEPSDDMFIIIRSPQSATANSEFDWAPNTVAADVTLTGFPGGVDVTDAIESSDGGESDREVLSIAIDLTNGAGNAITLPADQEIIIDIVNQRLNTPNKIAAEGIADITSWSIETQDSSNDIVDTAGFRMAIIEEQGMSATVDTTLTFTIAGVNDNANCTGDPARPNNTGFDSTTTTLQFGNLEPNSRHQTCHTLSIDTNAPNGYDLYVIQDGNLQSSAGDDIDQFVDGTRVDESSAEHWSPPEPSPNSEATQGHMGYTSSDASVFSSSNNFAGVPTGPASGAAVVVTGLACNNSAATSTPDSCIVEFDVEISGIQPTGSYTNKIQYLLVAKY